MFFSSPMGAVSLEERGQMALHNALVLQVSALVSGGCACRLGLEFVLDLSSALSIFVGPPGSALHSAST